MLEVETGRKGRKKLVIRDKQTPKGKKQKRRKKIFLRVWGALCDTERKEIKTC